MNDTYESPFSRRYASKEMKQLFSDDTRYRTWRQLWYQLAKVQAEAGLPITAQQLKQLEDNIDNIDYEVVKAREKEVRHDVMAHIYAYGQVAPEAAGIIHLGATSCYVTDNGDLIIYHKGLQYIKKQLKVLLALMSDFAIKFRDVPMLSFTHYQPAQPSTVGKRTVLWMQDLIMDLEETDRAALSMKFLGCRGTTGTEASFLELFDGDEEKIDAMNKKLANSFGFDECFTISAQTYPRKVDVLITNALSGIAQSLYKLGDDIRLLQHDGYLEEPFEKSQVGSSAMAYKRNPMHCERLCSLSRYLINLTKNTRDTAAVQWLDRTLDDSANRRITMPEAFLCADAILRLAQNIMAGLTVNKELIAHGLNDYLPFIATENIMMEAVKKGVSRQKAHEIIRTCSMKAVEEIRTGQPNRLIDYLMEAGLLTDEDKEGILKAEKYIGCSINQVKMFLNKYRYLYKDTERTFVKVEI